MRVASASACVLCGALTAGGCIRAYYDEKTTGAQSMAHYRTRRDLPTHDPPTHLKLAHIYITPGGAIPYPPNHTLPSYRCGWPVRVHAWRARL